MEDDLKFKKVEYLINFLLHHTQILNWSFDDQIIFYKSLKWRWPLKEDDLKTLKVEFISNHLLDHTHFLNLSLDDQSIC